MLLLTTLQKEKDTTLYLLSVILSFDRLEMYGRAYTWLLLGTYSGRWWTRRAPCDRTELRAALDTAILADLLPLSTTGETTVSGIVSIDMDVKTYLIDDYTSWPMRVFITLRR